MWTFFRGWRRKAGCVALVLALLLVMVSMRNRIVHDLVAVSVAKLDDKAEQHVVLAMNGAITWASWEVNTNLEGVADASLIGITPSQSMRFVDELETNKVRTSFRQSKVAYWMLTLPPTLLSAWLLLSKPPQSPKPTTGT
jgi:hypothetical protein